MSLNPPIRNWHGQRVWLIGASTGIGRALAEQLHALGATVIVSARKADALQAFADQIPGLHPLFWIESLAFAAFTGALDHLLLAFGRVDLELVRLAVVAGEAAGEGAGGGEEGGAAGGVGAVYTADARIAFLLRVLARLGGVAAGAGDAGAQAAAAPAAHTAATASRIASWSSVIGAMLCMSISRWSQTSSYGA